MEGGGKLTTTLLYMLPVGRGLKGCGCSLPLCSASQGQSTGLLRPTGALIWERQSPPSLAGDRQKRWEPFFPRRELWRLRPCEASSWGRMRGVDEREGDADRRYLFVLLHCDCSCNSSDLPLCFIL